MTDDAFLVPEPGFDPGLFDPASGSVDGGAAVPVLPEPFTPPFPALPIEALPPPEVLPGEMAVPYEPVWHPEDFDGIGTPLQDAEHWRLQQEQNSCAVATQTAVLESITGRPVAERELIALAEQNGWYDPASGTLPADVGKLLEAHGVPCEQQQPGDIGMVIEALERGDKVLVGVDGTEVAAPLRDAATGVPLEQPDAPHSIWIIGIDVQPDGSVYVIVNDPGHSGGRLDPIELTDFLNAWDDTGNHLTIARTGAA